MKPIIEVNHLSKKYKYGGSQSYYTLRDSLVNVFKSPFRILQTESDKNGLEKNEFWALKDVSFKVNQGEVIGIVGSNGAGKSTLLKILSRITPPTSGEAILRGRVGSLLEVGTGFQQELTGRENIYLNGAILGMKRREISNKFDEIVDFAEIDKFLDTPVKHYSSGMYMRLAFAVAAHLEPEILIVDEVLAVGDAQFQKKCLGKMSEVSKEGRTVLFVSHNMGAVEQMCDSGILLDQGKLKLCSNNVKDVVKEYIKPEGTITASLWENKEREYYSEYFYLNRMCLTDEDGNILPRIVDNAKDFYVDFDFEVGTLDPALEICYEVYDDENRLVYISGNTDTPEKLWPKIKRGSNTFRTRIPKRYLNEGLYYIKPSAYLHNRMSLLESTKHNFYLVLNIVGGLSDSPYLYSRREGILAPIFEWKAVE